jgi:hypothetical protein
MKKGEDTYTPGQRFGLLGTLWAGPTITEEGNLKVEPVPTSSVVTVETRAMMHLGYVIKSTETRRLLEAVRAKYGSLGTTGSTRYDALVPRTKASDD